MWIDQVGNIVAEISTLAMFLFSCVFFLSLSESLYNTIETISVWTVLGAIGANAIISAIKSVSSVVLVYREYRRQTAKIGSHLSKIRSIFLDAPNQSSFQNLTDRGGVIRL